MADTLSLISLLSFIIAGACLALAVIFWFAFHIPKVIGDLTGRTARKSIAGMHTSNESTGSKVFRRRGGYPAQGGSVGNVSNSRKMGSQETEPLEGAVTEEIETGVLNGNVSLEDDDKNVTVLLDGSNDTRLLSEIAVSAGKEAKKQLIMLEEIVLINTDEVIE